MASSPTHLARRIRHLRIAAGMTQARFARKLRISQQKLSDWENGKRLRSVLDALAVARLLEKR